MSVRPASSDLCHLLQEDFDLAEAIPAERRGRATESLIARILRLGPGALSAEALAPLPSGLGLLILDGTIIHRLGVGGRFGGELLRECDVIRPWPSQDASLEVATRWTVLEPTRLAVLDAEFAIHSGPFPELAGRLLARTVGRARNLVINLAIVHQARVDVRLHMLLWHLAGRWGRVRSDGTVLPLRLTHALLADLVAARRPTVTSALSELTRRDLVRGLEDGWLLKGRPPRELPPL